jgi:NAD(P)-dependent dehydrogenase (short-subunit alcohol dehydrogenase family)
VAAATGSTFLECDITDRSAVVAAFAKIGKATAHLDVLINNAGGFWEQLTTETTSEGEWDKVIDLNLKGVFLCSQQAIPLLRGSSSGRIITLGSLAGQTTMYRSSPPMRPPRPEFRRSVGCSPMSWPPTGSPAT